METKFVGIDVSKLTLDFDCLPVSAPLQFANDAVGIAALVDLLKGSGVERIVIEATGGYETAVASALAVAKLPVVVVNPKQVRDFAKATGSLAKTDRLDAKLLALFGERIMPPLPDEAQRALADLLDRPLAVGCHARAGEGTLEPSVTAIARKNVQQHIVWLDKCIAKLDGDLEERLRKSPVWCEKATVLGSVPGGGEGDHFCTPGETAGIGPAQPAGNRGVGGPGAVQRR